MKKYGPIRNYWEGSMQGEGYLKVVKPKIHNMKGKNWHVNAHTKLLEDHVFDRVLLEHSRQERNNRSLIEVHKMKYIRKHRESKRMIMYNSVHDVMSLLNKGEPVSFVKYKDDKYIIIINYTKQCDMRYVDISVKFVGFIEDIKMNVHTLELDIKEDGVDLSIVEKTKIIGYFVALPIQNDIVVRYKGQNRAYYITRENRMELDEHSVMMKPVI